MAIYGIMNYEVQRASNRSADNLLLPGVHVQRRDTVVRRNEFQESGAVFQSRRLHTLSMGREKGNPTIGLET